MIFSISYKSYPHLFLLTGEPIFKIKDYEIRQSVIIEKINDLMSETYPFAEQDVHNINCSIKHDTYSDISRNMTLVIYEFSPFASTDDYCLYVNSVQTPLVCSGSQRFTTSTHGPFESKSGWTFRLTLKDSTKELPKMKFWFSITS